jgi:hypothetical protein
MMIVGRRFEVVGGVNVSFGLTPGQLSLGTVISGGLAPLRLSLRGPDEPSGEIMNAAASADETYLTAGQYSTVQYSTTETPRRLAVCF